MITSADVKIFTDGLDHPECVAVHPDGSVWAGGEAGQIYRVPPAGGAPEEVARIPGGFVLGIAFAPDARWMAVCDLRHHCLQRFDLMTGRIQVFAEGVEGYAIKIPNYPAFRDNGDLFLSDSGSFGDRTGLILRFCLDGRGEIWHPGPLEFANGLAFASNESYLYVVESFGRPGVVRIRVNGDGSAGPLESFCPLPATVPDGLAFDSSGTLYVGCYAPSRIYSVSPSGEAAILAEDWTAHALSNCTNLAFGGPRFDRLFVANLGRWHISAIDLGRRGASLPCHRGTATGNITRS
jgi:sugar lactone lactonase YvrE